MDEEALPSGYANLHAEAEKWVSFFVYASITEGSVPDWINGYDRKTTVAMNGFEGFKGWNFNVHFNDHILHLIKTAKAFKNDVLNAKDAAYIAEKTAQLVKQFKDAHGFEPTTVSVNTVLQELNSEVTRYCTRWDNLMVKLRSVEQLFIAV